MDTADLPTPKEAVILNQVWQRAQIDLLIVRIVDEMQKCSTIRSGLRCLSEVCLSDEEIRILTKLAGERGWQFNHFPAQKGHGPCFSTLRPIYEGNTDGIQRIK